MPRFIDFAGRTVAKWSVLFRTDQRPGAHWRCRCECGREQVISGGVLSATAKAFERDGWGATGSGVSMMCRGCSLREKQRAGGHRKGATNSPRHRERIAAANRGRVLCGSGLAGNLAGHAKRSRDAAVRKCLALIESHGITADELFPPK